MKIVTTKEQDWQQLLGYRKNVLLTGVDLHCQGSRVQLVVIPAGETIPDHYHKTSSEVYIVQKGCCQLFVNDEESKLEPGSTLLMEPGDVHRLHNPGPQEFELLVFKTNAGDADTYWSS